VESAANFDGGAGFGIDLEAGFVGAFGPERASECFEAIPDDAPGLAIIGADVPDEAVGLDGETHDFGEREVRFAEATASDEDAETGFTTEDDRLIWFERKKGFARGRLTIHECLFSRPSCGAGRSGWQVGSRLSGWKQGK